MKKLFLFLLFLMFSITAHAGFQETPIAQPYLYKFVSGPAITTTVKTTSGVLHTLTVTGGTTSPIDIYDGTPAPSTLIYSFTTTNALQTYSFDIGFNSGCTVVTNGAALKYTVSYL